MEKQLIGYISWQGCFLCPMCNSLLSASRMGTPVYEVNIKPYSQDCAMCKRIIYKGKIPTILFDNKLAYAKYLEGEKTK
jgi:hypothetical protein